MNIEKFTNKSKALLNKSQSLAASSNNQYILPLHLFKVMLDEGEPVILNIINILNGDFTSLKNKVNDECSKLIKITGANQIYMSSDLLKVLDEAENISKANQDNFVTIERIFQALQQDNTCKKILQESNIFADKIANAITLMRKGQKAETEASEDSYDALNKYGRNVTQLGRLGKLDPVIGREDEIRRAIQVLSRRTKNNPVLIGEPGVGKTAIIEGLAQRIIEIFAYIILVNFPQC
jgi:ATP-dependent Clp protease ATP-binding subunit ClpB